MEKQCPVCNKIFITLNGRQKYCSSRCNKKRWKLDNKEKVLLDNKEYLRVRASKKKKLAEKELICPRCGKTFLNTKSKNYSYIRFCSFNCQNIYNRSKRREKERESEPMRKCLACGELFDPREFRAYKTVQTCSRKCTKKLWRMKHKDDPEYKKYRALRQRNRKHRIRANGGNVTNQEWEEIKRKVGYRCVVCGEKEPFKQSCTTLTQDHIVPISKGGKHIKENLQPLCMECNIRKYNK